MKRVLALMMAVIILAAAGNTAYAAKKISASKAKSIALKDAGLKKSKVRGLEAEFDDGKYEVEFTRKSNKAEYEYEISKKGRVLEKSVDYVYKHDSSTKKIGKEAARKKVSAFSGTKLSTIKKGTCTYEYDDDDDHPEGVYEVKFKKGNYRYEYEVLAPTGKIIEWGKKYTK